MKLKKEIPLLIIVLLPFIYLGYIWDLLPETVPTHWNWKGEIDAWGNKKSLILITFLLPGLTYIIFSLVPLIDPKKKIQSMGNKFYNLKFLLVLFMSALAVFIIYSVKAQSIGNTVFIILAIGVLYMLLGNYMKTIKANYFIGIRTPWTLENLTILLLFFTLVTNAQVNRPQEPKAPFNYIAEDIYFTNYKADSIKLAGTLTLPRNKKNPVVAILISGSGPQNRNSELKPFNHSPFLVLSDYLTNHGIAVLRYDDRGIAESEGNYKTATSFDFASDVEAAIAYLKTRNDINTDKIGLIGHSEGGLIAPIVASRNKNVAFVVLLAGTGVNGAIVLETQARRAAELAGVPKLQLDENEKLTNMIYGIVLSETDEDTIKTKITKSLNDFKVNNPTSPLVPYISDAMIQQHFGSVLIKLISHLCFKI